MAAIIKRSPVDIPPQSDWILASGFWSDAGFWRDDEVWID